MGFDENNNSTLEDWYTRDSLRAVEAKFEAQRIAFAPLAFQAARCLRDLGLLAAVDAAGKRGVTREELVKATNITEYAAGVLLEMGLSMNLLKLTAESRPPRFVLAKTGWFILHDAMTRANMDFVHDVCYAGAFHLKEALTQGAPAGLKVFGSWKTIYQALSSLPAEVKQSWFAFDHYYSDGAFPEALKVVFLDPKKHLMDIGGNTAKWALACYAFDPDVRVTIVDLPGQAEMARSTVSRAGADNRVSVHEADVLDPASRLPEGADAVWMSQFLDCFSLEEVTAILSKVAGAVDDACDVFVMEPLWDRQRYHAAAYALHATSLYFTVMANGNSKMYRTAELTEAVTRAGFTLQNEYHGIGPNDYSILRFRKKQ